MTSEWRHVPPISSENKGLRESPPQRHGCSFKATINFLIWNDVELVGLKTAISDLENVENLSKL